MLDLVKLYFDFCLIKRFKLSFWNFNITNQLNQLPKSSVTETSSIMYNMMNYLKILYL